MQYLSFLLIGLVSGCGLMLDSDAEPDSGAIGSDTGAPDVTQPDAGVSDAVGPPPDAVAPTDAALPPDAVVADAMRADVVMPDPPQVVAGYFESMSMSMFPAREGTRAFVPLPFYAHAVWFETSEALEPSLVSGRLIGPRGMVTTATVGSRPEVVKFVAGDALDDGYYCLEIDPTPSVRGPALDGEWSGIFPSGDGIEGGKFIYLFAVLVGDVDGNRAVDSVDLELVSDGVDPNADLDGDGDVDGADYLIVQRRYLNSLGPVPSRAPGAPCPDATGG